MEKAPVTGTTEDDGPPVQPMNYKDIPDHFKRVDYPFKIPFYIVYFLTAGLLTHGMMFYYLFYLLPLGIVSKWTLLYTVIGGHLTGLGLTVAHRYWAHRSFKANFPLRVLLMSMHTAVNQGSIFKWCRDHRVHHKHTDTDADPHTSLHGFWYAHITWLIQPAHPDCDKARKTIYVSDLVRDPVVSFQNKYYFQLSLFFCVLLPMYINHLVFPELSLLHNFAMNSTRMGAVYHLTALINSVAHGGWGSKPYNKHILPTDHSLVSAVTLGEGWHNYHHTFPWDYKSTDVAFKFNLTTFFIDFMAKIGWAWDLKTVSPQLLAARVNRTGDGDHPLYKQDDNADGKTGESSTNHCWGWGDEDLRQEDLELTKTVFADNARRGY